MIIFWDAAEYESMAKLLTYEGWVEFLKQGPQREPAYLLFVSVAMKLGDLLNVSFRSMLVCLQTVILFISALLLIKLFKKANISSGLTAAGVLIFGFSPAVANASLGVWSEIFTFPFIMLLVYTMSDMMRFLLNNNTLGEAKDFLLPGLVLSVLILSKALIELMSWALIFVLAGLLIKKCWGQKKTMVRKNVLLFCIFIAASQGGVVAYKGLNKIFNGQYTITNKRGHFIIYGCAVNRIQKYTDEEIRSFLWTIPDLGFCEARYPQETCRLWHTARQDQAGTDRIMELRKEGITDVNTISQTLLRETKSLILSEPLRYLFFYAAAFLQMFAWEGTNIGFVVYPTWITNWHNHPVTYYVWPILVDLLSFFSFLFLGGGLLFNKPFRKNKEAFALLLGHLIFVSCFIAFYSLVGIIKRFALPIAPLHVFSIIFSVHFILGRFKKILTCLIRDNKKLHARKCMFLKPLFRQYDKREINKRCVYPQSAL